MTTVYSLGHSLTRRLVGALSASDVRRLEDGHATEADMRAAACVLAARGDADGADFVREMLEDHDKDDATRSPRTEGSNHHG